MGARAHLTTFCDASPATTVESNLAHGRRLNETTKARLQDAVERHEHLGLGWMFVAQTLSGLDIELISQMPFIKETLELFYNL